MKTIEIKGKQYVPVVERIKEFHRICRGNIQTEIISLPDTTRIIVKATITVTHFLSQADTMSLYDIPKVYTGHSQAEWAKGMMGNVALEVAETSAIGRALGFANIGLLDGIASADEMRKTKKVDTNIDEDLDF